MGNDRGIPAAVTSFVGRDGLLDDALCVLEKSRLLTLSGPAGVGKTRLAIEVTRRAQARYDEVAVAPLAELTSSGDVERSLIGALEIVDQSSEPPLRVLVEYLRDRHVLLVLDNCEHLWEAVGDMVTVLLEEAPRVSVIATSRRYLEVAGEYVLPVPPLTIPAAGAEQSAAAESEAVVLLLDRAGAAGQAMRTRDAGWDELVELVRWSGGLPLALELIAFRMADGMPPGVILGRLDGGRILTGRRSRPHLRTHRRALSQVLDWSSTLCTEDERRLWARLSVFSGGFDLAMAEEVCGGASGPVAPNAMMDLLEGLVRQSIVIADGTDRFQQLQPIREHGERLLVRFGEEEQMRERHCEFVRCLVADAAECWFGPDELDWLRRVELAMPDVRAALAYCVTRGRAETGLRIVTDIARLRLPLFAAMLGEFCSWFETFLALAPPSPLRVEATAMLGWIRICQGARKRAKVLLDECLASSAHHPAVLFLSGAYLLLVDGDRASIELLCRSRNALLDAGARGDAHTAGLICALASGFLGTEDEARQAADECRADANAHRAPWAIGWAMWSQGLAVRTPQAALKLYERSLSMQVEMRDHWGACWSAEAIVWTWAATGMARPAAELLGGVIALQQRTGVQISGLIPFERERTRAIERIRSAIGVDSYEAAFTAGTELTTEQVYALALRPAVDPPREPEPPTLLTRRQWEIARLVAQGMTNKDIADVLIIAQRTVENHLGQVFTRLGARNRAQVAAWISERENFPKN